MFVLIAVSRLCHLRLVWIEEAYGSAAAAELLRGHALYRDVWFDKPPLYALIYAVWGALPGWPLRIGGILLNFAACWLAYRFARERWGEREGLTAAWLLGFFLIFGVPSAVLAFAPDLLMLIPHLAAVYLAWRRQPFWSGLVAGIAFLCHTKGALVLATCLVMLWSTPGLVLLGFAIPNLAFLLVLAGTGSVTSYLEQVWETGFLYSRDTFVQAPVWEALKRTSNWAGFHLVLVVGSVLYWRKERDWNWLIWTAFAFVSIFAGWRFFPRYYFALLPPLVLAAARGVWLISRRWRIAIAALLLVPLVRFGPAYLKALHPEEWADTALMNDSREVARFLREQPRGTLFVWGYRPDIYVFSGFAAGTPFLDSQPISGVFADRHLFSSRVSVKDTGRNIDRLLTRKPAFIVDGLGLLNPELAITRNTHLRHWLALYREIGRTEKSVIYALASVPFASGPDTSMPDGTTLFQKR